MCREALTGRAFKTGAGRVASKEGFFIAVNAKFRLQDRTPDAFQEGT
jgi:hypothetical protein